MNVFESAINHNEDADADVQLATAPIRHDAFKETSPDFKKTKLNLSFTNNNTGKTERHCFRKEQCVIRIGDNDKKAGKSALKQFRKNTKPPRATHPNVIASINKFRNDELVLNAINSSTATDNSDTDNSDATPATTTTNLNNDGTAVSSAEKKDNAAAPTAETTTKDGTAADNVVANVMSSSTATDNSSATAPTTMTNTNSDTVNNNDTATETTTTNINSANKRRVFNDMFNAHKEKMGCRVPFHFKKDAQDNKDII